jgi:hypothetical protein
VCQIYLKAPTGVRTAGALVLHLTYGYKIKEEGTDLLVDLANKVTPFLLNWMSAHVTRGVYRLSPNFLKSLALAHSLLI